MKFKIIPVTPFQQNCSIIWCEDTMKAAIVDPGGESQKIINFIEQQKLTIEKILLTHCHIDHVGATTELKQYFNTRIEGPHKDEQFWIDMLPQQSQMFQFPHCETFTPDRWLEQGDTVKVGEQELTISHCPGHTPGHIVFHNEQKKILFVGDVLFKGSIGRTDFPKGNHQQLIDSIKQHLFSLADETEFVPGHGPMSTIGWERANNPHTL